MSSLNAISNDELLENVLKTALEKAALWASVGKRKKRKSRISLDFKNNGF